MRTRGLIVSILGLAAAGCGSSAVVDMAAKPDMVAVVDCAATPDDPSCRCSTDESCANSQAGPRCDVSQGRCVVCLPANDNCAAGQVCLQTNGEWACSTTCAGNADCAKLGGGTLCCGGLCVNTANDVKNCGSCNAACPAVPNGSPGCAQGVCTVAACNPGFDDCDKATLNGCEAQISNDTANCGACNNVCQPFSNGLPTCVLGKCSAICAPGYSDCNSDNKDGCEIDSTFDPMNCGGCGKTCVTPPNAVAACDQGKCGYRCKLGFADCDGNPANGCEANTGSDANNCGHCANVCPLRPNADSASCTAGQCTNTCKNGFGDCDNNAFNGCEADLSSSLLACGGCGKLCKNNNAVATCSQGVCNLQCAPGWTDCNNNPVDGCEANLLADPNNCGKCGVVCPQNLPACAQAQCIASIHGTVAWPMVFNFVGNSCNLQANGVYIGNFQAVNLGLMTWKACMIEASKRNAMVTTPTYGNWPTPGWWATRHPQGANPNLAMTGSWSTYTTADINTNQQCNVMHEPQSVQLGQFNSKGSLANTISYDGNSWHYQDFGIKYIDECTLLAGQYGASIITPWTIGLPNGDNYWQGILHTCSVYSWSAGNGTTFSYDNTVARASMKGCMLGWIDG